MKAIKWILGSLIFLFFVVYFQQIIEINSFLKNHSPNDLVKNEYDQAKNLYFRGGYLNQFELFGMVMELFDLDQRGDKAGLNEWITEWEMEREKQDILDIKKKLSESKYYDAINILYQIRRGLENTEILDLFKDYETENFDELKESLIETSLEWNYDYENIKVPAQYSTYWKRDFFGDWYSITQKTMNEYSYNDYTGAYLALKVKNNFKAIDIKGNIYVSAREETSGGDVANGVIGGLIDASVAGFASNLLNIGDPDEWAMAGLAFGTSTIWDKERNTSIRNIEVKPKKTIYHTGFIKLKGKRFAKGSEPKISKINWYSTHRIYNSKYNKKLKEYEFKSLKIEQQIWMTENLNISYKKRNGEYLRYYQNWTNDLDPNNVNSFGRLYTWDIACKICPEGWRLPTINEWDFIIKNGRISELNLPFTGYTSVPNYGKNYYSLEDKTAQYWSSSKNGDFPQSIWIYEKDGKIVYQKDQHFGYFGLSVRCIKE